MADPNTDANQENNADGDQAIDDIDAILDADYDRIQAGEARPEESDADDDSKEKDSKDNKDDDSGQSDDEADEDETKDPAGGTEDDENDVKGEKDGDDETKKGDAEPATVAAPDSWTPDAKAKFKEADPIIQQEILKRETDFQNGHAKSEDARQLAKEFKETVAPYEAIIMSEGGTPMRAVADLMNMGYILRRGTAEQKTELILSTAKRFNVDLGQVEQGDDDEDEVDPKIVDLQKQVTSLKNQNQDQSDQDQQNRNDEALKFINEFRDAKDSKGNPVNPHYDAVRGTMAVLINSGSVKSIKDAYDQAIWSDPTVRELMLKSQKKEVDKTKLVETKKKAKAARKAAGTQVKSDGGNVAPAEKDWDEDLSDAYEEIQAR